MARVFPRKAGQAKFAGTTRADRNRFSSLASQPATPPTLILATSCCAIKGQITCIFVLRGCQYWTLIVANHKRDTPNNIAATTAPTQLNSALPRLDDGEFPGLVELAAAADPLTVPVVFELFAAVLFASGPVKKKLPAIGLPNPTCSAKSERLKLLMGVEAFTNCDATVVKFAGCTKRSNM